MDQNEFKDQKYVITEIESTNIWFYASQISNDESYLAYGVDLSIKIYDLIQNKIIKEIQIEREITACQFTDDSKFLYIGSYQYIYGYDVSHQFEQILKLPIHQEYVNNIKTIQNQYLISCSDDRTIIKTDLQNQKELFKLIGHTDIIYGIEYDETNDIIISGSHDKSVKIWNCIDQSIIINRQQFNNYITQIQLINKGQYLLTLEEDGNLIKWKIDLIIKDLVIVKQYKDQNNIFNFYQVNQGQNIILICEYCIKIMDNDYKIIDKIDHTGGGKNIFYNFNEIDSTYLDCKQLDNAKIIQIRSGKKILLAIAQN